MLLATTVSPPNSGLMMSLTTYTAPSVLNKKRARKLKKLGARTCSDICAIFLYTRSMPYKVSALGTLYSVKVCIKLYFGVKFLLVASGTPKGIFHSCRTSKVRCAVRKNAPVFQNNDAVLDEDSTCKIRAHVGLRQ